MTIYETDAILLGWHISDGPQGHWVKFKLPLAITDGHPFALFNKGPEHGQRFRMTFEAIGDDEQPQGLPSFADAEGNAGDSSQRAGDATSRTAASPAALAKPKKHWDDYSPSQQAGMACNSGAFQEWMRARGGYGALPDGTSPSDLVRLWLYDELAINSRSDLDTNPEAAKRWRELYGMFQIDTRYSDAAR